MALHQKYEDIDFIKELMRAFLCHDQALSDQEFMHRQLKLFLELIKIDRPDLLKSDEELQSLWTDCKEQVNEQRINSNFNIS